VLDCIAGTLGFINSLVQLLTNAKLNKLIVDGGIPYKKIFQVMLQFLICCCGAVGIQAFNYLRVRTARLLLILKRQRRTQMGKDQRRERKMET